MVRDFVHDPAAYYVYTTLELTQYLRQIRPERFFQHADMFDHLLTRVQSVWTSSPLPLGHQFDPFDPCLYNFTVVN